MRGGLSAYQRRFFDWSRKSPLNRIRGVVSSGGPGEWQTREQFFAAAFKTLTFNGIRGDYVEFGSCGGMTFELAFRHAARSGHDGHLWSFDSFEGLPASRSDRDVHPQWPEGNLSMSIEQFVDHCTRSGIPADRYTAVKGFFEETLRAGASAERPELIALAYVDCDLYTSTVEVLAFLQNRLQNGMIVAFDDYYCASSSHPAGEYLALREFLDRETGFDFVPYRAIGWGGASFMVMATG